MALYHAKQWLVAHLHHEARRVGPHSLDIHDALWHNYHTLAVANRTALFDLLISPPGLVL